jgi:hypothetical protein
MNAGTFATGFPAAFNGLKRKSTGNHGFSNIWPGLPSCNFTINQFQDPATIKQCETFFPGLSQNVQTLCCWFQSPKKEQMFVQHVCQSNGFPENRVYLFNSNGF